MKLLFTLISLCLLIVNISLILGSFSASEWAKINVSQSLGLFQCKNCNTLFSNWNYECLARTICPNTVESGACSLYQDLYKASYAYLVLEFASLIFAILFFEKLLLIITNDFSGTKMVTISIAIGMITTHVLATILWFGYTKSTNHCNVPSNINSRPDICYSSGAKLAISNIIFMTCTVVFFLYVYCRSETVKEVDILHGKFLGIPYDKWGWVTLIFTFFGIILILASLAIDSWAISPNFHGGLYRCKDCKSTQWLAWECLQQTECNINSSSQNCKQFKNLAHAGATYIGLEAVTIIFLLLFLQALTAYIMGKEYGNKYLNYAYVVIVLGIHLLSVVSWFGLSGAIFEKNCENNKICADKGPSLSIASNFVIVPACLLFLVLFYKRTYPNETYSQVIRHNVTLNLKGTVTPDDTQFIKNLGL